MIKNVLGSQLKTCSLDPVTGFFRDGKCDTCAEDVGLHTVCAELTQRFLEYSRDRGNDLITPRPEFGFAGLRAGDKWCICLGRWIEAFNEDPTLAPKIALEATHHSVLEHVPLDVLKKYALNPVPPSPLYSNGFSKN